MLTADQNFRELTDAYRQRHNIPDETVVYLAHNACRVCGGIVTFQKGVCVCCGASGKQRSIHPLGNYPVTRKSAMKQEVK